MKEKVGDKRRGGRPRANGAAGWMAKRVQGVLTTVSSRVRGAARANLNQAVPGSLPGARNDTEQRLAAPCCITL